MASRMDRYQRKEDRSTRNESLYKSIEDLDNYSNIEGFIPIEKTNEIDITKVQRFIQSRENYKKNKEYRQVIPEEKVEPEEDFINEKADRTYDIRDVLTKAKETREEPNDKYRTLKNVNYDVIKRLSIKKIPEDEEELKELRNTMTMHTKAQVPENDDMGLLDDLKSNTMVGDSGSIKKLIEEAKEEQRLQEETTAKVDEEPISNIENIDKSFYTSSLGFTDKDFEDLKNLGEDIKKHNGILRILIIILMLVVFAILVFVGFQYLNK